LNLDAPSQIGAGNVQIIYFSFQQSITFVTDADIDSISEEMRFGLTTPKNFDLNAFDRARKALHAVSAVKMN